MAISRNKVIHYNMNNENTNAEAFKRFMSELLYKMTKEQINNSIFILDNLICHKTLELYQFYNENKLKILFNAPYISEFNMIEYLFRYLKNITYKKLYCSVKELKSDVISLINNAENIDILEKIYKETLRKYISFYNENKLLNLNS